MNYQRVLLLTELDADAASIAPTVRRVAPAAAYVLVVAIAPRDRFAWFSGAVPGDFEDTVAASLNALRHATAAVAPNVEVSLAAALDPAELASTAGNRGIDLLVGAWNLPLEAMTAIADVRKRLSLAVLWIAAQPAESGPITKVWCEAIGDRALAAVAGFLRDHGDRTLHATVVQLDPRPRDLESALGVAGITARVDLATPGAAFDGGADLLVLARFPGALLRAARFTTPILILPPRAPIAPAYRRAIDVSDLVADYGVMRASVRYASGLGRNDPLPDQDLAFVSGGRVAAVVASVGGVVELPPGLQAASFGVFRATESRGLDPLEAIEVQASVIRPDTRAIVLFDAEISDDAFAQLLATHRRSGGPDLLAVRLRPTRRCDSIRERLRRAGLPPRVADASAVLDEGAAFDVSQAMDPVRLARVGARMRASGFAVAAIVYDGPRAPRTLGFAAWRSGDIGEATAAAGSAPPLPVGRLEATTGARLIGGNHIELEMDNAKARHWMLDAIARSQERLHMQLYMAVDDDVGAPVEAALAAAGARGVKVRVVVDSLHGMDGSYGLRNPLVERLRARPGVELLVSRPVTGLPTLEDVKQRDHRKLLIADGRVALVGGRNLSHEYYTGFDEVRLDPATPWREVPWLDAGARAEGPVVAELERSFLEAWQVAGGAPFEIVARPAVGSAAARVVAHHGLRDAWTLEAYLALIESATSHVYAVNGFPLILELQHALLRAIRRGVRVRTLFGSLTPTHDGTPFGGPWSSARLACTEMVHSRMDALVAAGGEAYQFAVPAQPAWSAGLGPVHPHVHAKVMSVDGRVCAVGSANLDVTAGYFENELMLVIEDEAITRGLETRIEQLLGDSTRVERDPAWERTAARRQWMRHWPGVLAL